MRHTRSSFSECTPAACTHNAAQDGLGPIAAWELRHTNEAGHHASFATLSHVAAGGSLFASTSATSSAYVPKASSAPTADVSCSATAASASFICTAN